jgi:hypothetical protein
MANLPADGGRNEDRLLLAVATQLEREAEELDRLALHKDLHGDE